jgi:hypothetical protein
MKEIQIATIYINKYKVYLINTLGFNNEELKDTNIFL